MSESPTPERPRHPDDEGRDGQPDFEMAEPPGDVDGLPYDHGWADAGEITDLGTGDDPPKSGE